MILKINLLTLTLLIGQLLFCQNAPTKPIDKKTKFNISTRLGLNTLTQFNIQFEKIPQKNVGVILKLGYHYGSGIFTGNNSGPFCSGNTLFKIFGKMTGFAGNFGVSVPRKKGKWAILLNYKNLTANDIIEDEGCYSGSNSASYSSFNWSAKDYGILWYNDFGLSESGINFYFGLGYGMRNELKEYTIEGTFSDQRPSDRVIKELAGYLQVDIGVRINFIRIRW